MDCYYCQRPIDDLERDTIMPAASAENITKGIDWTRFYHKECLAKARKGKS